jgi:hypothetical protein
MKVTKIEWLDAKSVVDAGWAEVSSLEGFGLATVESAGFIFDETDDYVVLICSHSEGDMLMGGLTIPKVMIQSRKDYK